jgi:hypothetical protein
MKSPLRGRGRHAHGNRRRIGSRRFHPAGCLPLADESRRITRRTAIRHHKHFIFATADRAISRRQAIVANDAYRRAGRSLETLGPDWPWWAFRPRGACRTTIALRTGWTGRTGITLGPFATIGEADSQSPHDNKMHNKVRCPHDHVPFVQPTSCAFAQDARHSASERTFSHEFGSLRGDAGPGRCGAVGLIKIMRLPEIRTHNLSRP